MNEALWRQFERTQARRERIRLIRLGYVRHVSLIEPQLLVRNPDVKGGWSPQIVGAVQ